MNERFDELKGSVKEGAGKLTGDKDTQAEGRAEREGAAAERKVKGTAQEIKGRIQEGVGDLTDDEARRAQGTADRLKGETNQRP